MTLALKLIVLKNNFLTLLNPLMLKKLSLVKLTMQPLKVMQLLVHSLMKLQNSQLKFNSAILKLL